MPGREEHLRQAERFEAFLKQIHTPTQHHGAPRVGRAAFVAFDNNRGRTYGCPTERFVRRAGWIARSPNKLAGSR